ncbi:MAG: helix-hairpin-helix domain-containing protein [Pseudomonadales bacterium]|jgi:competence protein ComEA|nr:helix-hairpin-helix domain-containing protein [Pseudomonadales bacterium]
MDMFGKSFPENRLVWIRTVTAMLLLVGALAGSAFVLAEAQKVNINTASAAQLAAELAGVGESKSVAIVEDRQTRGAFKTPQDITRVKGIGEAILLKNKNRIVVK